MGCTKIICVEETKLSVFQEEVNKINDEHYVFATQTHVNCNDGQMIYTAVLFTRGGKK